MELFEEWLKHNKEERNSRLLCYIRTKFDMADISEESLRDVQMKLAGFSSKFAEKWASSRMTRERFLSKNKSWLEGADIQFTVVLNRPCASSSSGATSRLQGRPRKDFQDASFKTKKRRVEGLVQSWSASELVTAAEVASRLSGHRNVAKAIREVSDNSGQSTTNVASPCANARLLTSDEALAYYIDSKATTHSYKQTRKWSMKAGHQLFPSYHSLSKSKMSCRPSQEHISVTETRADINLQGILDKTAERLVQAQSDVIRTVLPVSSFTLISKWGCDGSSGHSTYKQKFEDVTATDEFLFVFSFVPLRLYNGHHIIWQNPRPSSTLYCRPIKFIFSKETTEFTITETNKVLEEISQLLPTLCSVDGSQISVQHNLLLTMTDGKVCNALTDTRSAQKCFICGATPIMMNGELKNFVSKQENFAFGLSTLHGWIRCFECLLHISYRLDIKKWQARSEDDKASVKQRSDLIKQKFKNILGLIVDKPKPGYGNTNDGNTARRFFANAELSGEITGIDVNIIKKFNILLRTLSSGYDINLIDFEKLCHEIRAQYLNLYSWYYMPATVHKLLVHSTDVIKTCLLPIGQLSEEAQEARNKDCRRFREHHTRKRSRIATNTDLLNMLIITSDPLINSLREVPRKTIDKLPSEVLKLIIPPSTPTQSTPSNLPRNEEDYIVPDSSEYESDSDESTD